MLQFKKICHQLSSLTGLRARPVGDGRIAPTGRRQLAHSLAEELPEGDYRHTVITLPKKMGLRKRFQLNPRLHRQIGRLIHRVLTRWTASQIGCHRNRREECEKLGPVSKSQCSNSRISLGRRARTPVARPQQPAPILAAQRILPPQRIAQPSDPMYPEPPPASQYPARNLSQAFPMPA